METSAITKLKRKEIVASMENMDDQAVRFLVDNYYQMQDNRIRTGHQIRAASESGEPNQVLAWLAEQNELLEKQLKRALDYYTLNHPVGKWMRSIKGMGPVITAGILAHIDINKAPTAGHIWSYAGLVDGVKWEKGQKRPWNADLRRLLWLMGESFVKVSNYDDDVYGKLYKQRKELENKNNDEGKYADQAARILTEKKWDKTTDAYKAYSQGKLPPAHIHARAKRWVVKLFISHLHHVWYVTEFKKDPPRPFVIEHLGHAHFIPIPNFPM